MVPCRYGHETGHDLHSMNGCLRQFTAPPNAVHQPIGSQSSSQHSMTASLGQTCRPIKSNLDLRNRTNLRSDQDTRRERQTCRRQLHRHVLIGACDSCLCTVPVSKHRSLYNLSTHKVSIGSCSIAPEWQRTWRHGLKPG